MDLKMFNINIYNKATKKVIIKIFNFYKTILPKQKLKMYFKIVTEKRGKINRMNIFNKKI
jgi:hypothetical protein